MKPTTKKLKRYSLLPLLLCTFSQGLHAKQLWSDASLSYLSGSDYEVGDPDRQVYTFELATGQSWGDTFSFVDRLESDNGDRETYFEIGARYSIGKRTANGIAFGPISDIALAAQWESATFHSNAFSFAFDHYLYGLSLDWKIPGFRYFNTTLYFRNNEGPENNEQLTIVWGLPFSIGNAKFMFDGFWDIATKLDDGTGTSSNLTPQLKYDLGHSLLSKEGTLYIGVEYVYWTNKFNIQDVDEKNTNMLVKWHF